MRITMIGTGYVGLVSGVCFADFGHNVICVDKDATKIDALNAGQLPIFEPGLDVLIQRNRSENRLQFTTDIDAALQDVDVVFIAVGTPSRRGDGHADLSYVYAAAQEIAEKIKTETVLILKSTVPVGTGDEVEKIVNEHNKDVKIHVVSNPEFLREGAAIEDFKKPDRIVVGLNTPDPREKIMELYRPLMLEGIPMLMVERRTSELIKYASNAFLAMKITFINEMADLCEKVGADALEVAKGIGMDARIGKHFLQPGPGYGGSCFPKDTLALCKTAQEAGVDLSLIESTVEANNNRKTKMTNRILAALGTAPYDKTVGVLGLTFKANTDDLRDSPALAVIEGLLANGVNVKAYDPQGMEGAKPLFPNVEFCDGPLDVAKDADALVLATEWNAFRALDLTQLKDLLRTPILIDLRNIYHPQTVINAGLDYIGVGRYPKK